MENLSRVTAQNEIESEKKRKIEELCGGTPKVLDVLSGGITKVEALRGSARYKQGSYKDLDPKGFLSGGKARGIAAAEISRHFPEVQIVTNSTTVENAPSEVSVMAEELKRCGVAPEHIIVQKKSHSTFTELIEMIKLVANNQWRHVVIVTNEFQIPRAAEMLKQIDTLSDPDGASKDPSFRDALAVFKKLSPRIVFVSAESILPIRNPDYSQLIAEAKNSLAWQERVASEDRGVKQLQEGTYWKKPESK